MRPKFLIAIIFVMIAVLFSISSCESPNNIKTAGLKNKSIQEKISDFNKKVKGLTTFCLEINKLEIKYRELNQDAKKGFNNSISYNEQVPYARILRNNYLKWSEDLSRLQLCHCITDAFNHYKKCIKQKHIAISFLLEKDLWGYDKANARDMEEYNETKKEVLKLMKVLNIEAEELGLSIPYPDFSINPQTVSTE